MTKIMNAHNEYVVDLHYDITLACNNRCSYCYALDYLDNKKKFNEETFGQLKEALVQFRKDNPEYKIRLTLLGGDPFVIENFSRVKELPVDSVEILSNLNFPKRHIDKIMPTLQSMKCFVAASWHESSDIELVKSNVLRMKGEGIDIGISFLLDDKNLPWVYEHALWAIGNDIPFDVDIIRDKDNNDLFTDTDDARYGSMLINSRRLLVSSAGEEVYNTIDDRHFNVYDMYKYDLKNISSQYYTECKLSALAVRYDGTINSQCGYHYKDHISNGLKIPKVFCDKRTCYCNTTTYKRLLRPKAGAKV